MSRIFDHTKQYACTEVFRLEELQGILEELEEMEDEEKVERHMPHHCRRCPFRTLVDENIRSLKARIEEFFKNLEEQEKRK